MATSKNCRICIRLASEDKELIERAAKVSGKSINGYIVDTIMNQALMDSKIVLNNNSRDLLLSALTNPPEPNERLKELFR